MRLEKPKNEEKVNEFANFIVNNLSFGQSVNILIENAKEVAEYMVRNNCKIEDFHIYLDKEKRLGAKPQNKEEKKGFFANLLDKVFKKEKPVKEQPVRSENQQRRKKGEPFTLGPRRSKRK